jgi:uncharacterized protein YukJ
MPLKSYGVLKGRPIDRRLGTHANAHYQVHLVDDDDDYRIAVNVRSKLAPSALEYLIDDRFRHPVIAPLPALAPGFHVLPRRPGGLALDFIRGNLFDRTRMVPLPFDVPGPDNDLNEALDRVLKPALADEDAMVYAFGERWGPESTRDKIFGFKPGNGIHDIHMNQGNAEGFVDQDGVWQDGAMLVHLPSQDRWVAVFLKFQSQTWHTDDVTGHRIEGTIEAPVERDGLVRIVGALVNPTGPAPERETVTLLNTSPQPVPLDGWAIADRNKQKHRLSGTIAAGATLAVALPQQVQLGNQGGIITLLDDRGLKIDGVAYTKDQASREGWTIIF